MNRDADKRAAAEAACAEVADGMLVGLGTGSTAAFAIAALGRRAAEGLRIRTVATSLATEAAARAAGLTVLPFEDVARVDLTIDGVDEIDPGCRAIKGAGGALLREKIVATATDRMIAIADGSKAVDALGRGPVPVEVLPFARSWIVRALGELGGDAVVRVGAQSDQGNLLFDVRFAALGDVRSLAAALAQVPGLLGHGLFLTEIDAAYLAEGGSVRRIDRPK